jgi:hypothetical protein
VTVKPPLPATPFDDWPRIPVDETDGSPFREIHRLAVLAADDWTFGPDGPYKQPGMTMAQITRGHVREALLHLLELGLIDIDEDRLNAASSFPMSRPKTEELR